jgi:hypothetical protein
VTHSCRSDTTYISPSFSALTTQVSSSGSSTMLWGLRVGVTMTDLSDTRGDAATPIRRSDKLSTMLLPPVHHNDDPA